MSPKPKLTLQTTTLWDYPSQHYGETTQGDPNYKGATPSYVIWNLLERYTREGDVVVDPMCGSGTTLDVAKDLGRRARGFDLAPHREDIERADARALPLEDASADFVFVDPPYSTHLKYSDDPDCIGRLPAHTIDYYAAMDLVFAEIDRVLKPGRYMGLYISDSRHNKQAFSPIGFRLFSMLEQRFAPVDVIAVVRRNRTLKRGRFHSEAEKGNFFLRGFNYLIIMKKEAAAAVAKPSRRAKRVHRKPSRTK